MSDKTAPAAFDLDDIAAIDQAELNIKNRNGQPTGWIWTIAGPGHPQTIALTDRLTKEGFNRAKAQEMARVNGKKWKGDDESADEVVRRSAEAMAGRILGWSPVTFHGKDYPFTKENAVAIFLDPARGDTLFAQMADFIADERSFMKRSENG